MSELDRLKEQLAYLKFWQGIMVVTDISLVGWLVSTADGARALTVVLVQCPRNNFTVKAPSFSLWAKVDPGFDLVNLCKDN